MQPRSTKAEILEAYHALESAYKDLETKQLTPPKTVETVKATSKKQVISQNDTQVSMEEVINSLGQFGEKFNFALSQLSRDLLVEAAALKEVRTTVETESSTLTSLYKLTIEEDTLGNLLNQHTDISKEYEETLKQKRKESEKAWFEKHQAWQDEHTETSLRLQEEESSDKKSKKRDETEYRYNLTLKRELSEEEYNEQNKQQDHVLSELEETRGKSWEEREKEIAEREKQFQDSKNKVECFPEELKTAIKKAKDEGTGIARHQAKIKADFAAKEFTGDENVEELKIRSLEEQVKNQSSQIDKLSKQLESALKQAQELAVKAIEGGANQNSFEALKEIALEQAKSQPKAK